MGQRKNDFWSGKTSSRESRWKNHPLWSVIGSEFTPSSAPSWHTSGGLGGQYCLTCMWKTDLKPHHLAIWRQLAGDLVGARRRVLGHQRWVLQRPWGPKWRWEGAPESGEQCSWWVPQYCLSPIYLHTTYAPCFPFRIWDMSCCLNGSIMDQGWKRDHKGLLHRSLDGQLKK